MSVLSELFSKLLKNSSDDLATRIANNYTDDAVKAASRGFAKEIGQVPLTKAGKGIDLSDIMTNNGNLQQSMDRLADLGFKKRAINNFRNTELVNHGKADALDWAKFGNGDNNLIATHNLTQDKLNSAANLGGLVQPSIAAYNPRIANKAPNSKYGDVTLVMNRSAVDPTITKNKIGIYDRDAYTPVFPDNISGDITAEQVNEIMNKQPRYAVDDIDIGMSKNIKKYRNLDSLYKDANRLVGNGDYDSVQGVLGRRSADLMDELGLLKDPHTAEDMYGELMSGNTPSGITLTPQQQSAVNEMRTAYQNMPTNMFEIKPRSVMSGSDFYGAYIPQDADQSVIDNLNKLGITNINIYDPKVGVEPQLQDLARSGRRFVSPYVLGLGALAGGTLTGLMGGNNESQQVG